MTIRARLTLWYASILVATVLLMMTLSFLELARERAAAKASPDGYREYDGWEDVATIALSCGLPAAIIGLAGGWWVMRRALAPVTALTAVASQLHERNLGERLPRTGNHDELDQLTVVFNSMTERLEHSFNRIREFTLHASHELKTPLTVMRGELELALEENPAPLLRERLLSQIDEIGRLTHIVDGLTLLTKADAGQVALQRETVALEELMIDCLADAQILARPFQVEVQLPHCEPVSLPGDRHRLRQLLLNLTDNAIKYNHPGGNVSLALTATGGAAEITIANTGPGIPLEILPRVFDRFFRGDPAHSPSADGCGLGLSIAQWIVTAHRGSIRITSQLGGLTTVTVHLPIAPVSPAV